MKAEHRKELESNALAERVERVVEAVKQGPSSTTLVVWVVLVLAVVAYATWRYVASSNSTSQAALFLKVEAATDPDVLQDLAKNSRSSPAGHAALFKAARTLRYQGFQTLAYSPDSARKKLEQASALYEQLAPEVRNESILSQEANEGVATIQRSLGNLDKAQDYYQRVVTLFPTSRAGEAAAKQLTELKDRREGLKKFYDELAQRSTPPPPPTPPTPTVAPKP